MNIYSQKQRSTSGALMKILGGSAAFALVLQLMLGGFFSAGEVSAQVADTSLTVTKVVNGGPNVVADFDLFVDGQPVTSGVATTTMATGTHTVTETNLPGYTATFSGDCNAAGEVTLEEGVAAECTVTNTYATSTTASTSSLTVTKVVVGGPNVVADFDLFVDGQPVTSGVATTTSAGPHTVTESNLPGYTPSFSGDCNAAGVVVTEEGGDHSCTITNTFATTTATTTTLTVTKIVVGGTATTSDFDLFVDGMPITSGVATTTMATGTHTVTEDNLPGYTAAFSGDCNAAGQVTLAEGDDDNCIITNTFATSTATTSSLTVTKVVVGGGFTAEDFPLFVDGVPVTNGVATTTLGAGTFTITEANATGYTAAFSGDCNADGEVTLALGDDMECVITNTFSTSTAATSTPIIDLEGDAVINIFICQVDDGELFVDPGFSVVDSAGVAITGTSTGSVNLEVAGTYTITYTATDAAGNTATTTRTVIVRDCSSGGGGGGGGGQTNRGIERAAAVTPPGDSIAGQGLGLNTFQTFFLPPGQVLGAQTQFRGDVRGAQSVYPGMPSTGGEPLLDNNKFPNSLPMALLGLMLAAGIGFGATRFSSRMFRS